MTLATVAVTDTFEQWRGKDNAAISLLNQHDQILSTGLTASAVTYYVRTDGNDANDGSANTAANAFLTLQAAISAASKRVVGKGMFITINVADGTYTGQTVISGSVQGSTANAGGTGWAVPILITGTSNAILTSTNAPATLSVGPGSVVGISGLKLQSSGTNGTRHAMAVSGGGLLQVGNVVFGACAGDHINAADGGTVVYLTANYTISGGAAHHILATTGAVVSGTGLTVTLTGTPVFATSFVGASYGAVANYSGNTFSGTATGPQYTASYRGSVFSGGTTLPGSATGTLSTGGGYENQYIFGVIDGTDIGTNVQGAGKFTTLNASGAASVDSISATKGVSAASVTATGAVSGNSVSSTTSVSGATGSFTNSLISNASTEARGVVYLGGSAQGNESMRVTTIASAVNRLLAKGAVTTGNPSLSADGSDTNITMDFWSKGAGEVRLGTNASQLVLELLHTISSVNNWSMSGSTTGNAVTLKPAGSDANIAANVESKGTGIVNLRTNGSTQVEVRNTTGAVNRTYLTGSVTGGRVVFGGDGSDTNVGLLLQPKGSGDTLANGNFTASGNITGFSDERLKTNWRDLPANFIEKLAKLKSGVFDRTDIEETQVGVSAQSLKRLLPQAVIKTGKWFSVNYGNAALVACVELAKRLVTQQKEISDLKRRLEKLERAVQ